MAKVLQAGKAFEALERTVVEWNAQNSLDVPVRIDPDDRHGFECFHSEKMNLPLIQWSTQSGEGFHSLRSALDLLAYEMSHLERQPKKPRRVAFPICDQESDWDSAVADRLESVPASLVARIRSVQPFLAVRPQAQPLSLLREIDDMNKHRTSLEVHAMPSNMYGERFTPVPAEHFPAEVWDRPLIRLNLDKPMPPEAGAAIWHAEARPFLLFDNRFAPLFEVQRWLYDRTRATVQFIAGGNWPEPVEIAGEPEWAVLPPGFTVG